MKYFILIFCVAIVMCSCVKSNNVADIRLDPGMSEEFGLKEAQDIIKEMATFMDKEQSGDISRDDFKKSRDVFLKKGNFNRPM